MINKKRLSQKGGLFFLMGIRSNNRLVYITANTIVVYEQVT